MKFFSFKLLKPLVSGIATYYAIIGLKPFLSNFNFLVELLIALPVCMLIYALIMFIMKLDEEDRSFISSLGIIKKGLKRNR